MRSCIGNKRVTVLLAVCVVALLAIGCGGSGNATTGGAPVTTTSAGQSPSPGEAQAKARLIAQADVICRRFNEQLINESRAEAANVSRTAPRNATIEMRAVEELAKLTPPSSLANDWTQILAYRRTLAEELVTVARDAAANNAAGMQALGASKKKIREKLTQLAGRDGFKDCTSVGTVSAATLFPTLHPHS
jgi:hypothetical protein